MLLYYSPAGDSVGREKRVGSVLVDCALVGTGVSLSARAHRPS